LNQPANPSDWEHYFTEEALLVEEMLLSGDMALLNQSRIRIALENKILNWTSYTHWLKAQTNYAVIKSDLYENEIELLKNKYLENKKIFEHYEIWSADLIAIESWDNQIIVLGLLPTEKISIVPNCIFIFCPPMILNLITASQNLEINEDDSLILKTDDLSTKSQDLLEIDQNISKPININFSNLQNKNTQTAFQIDTTDTTFSIWNLVEKNHLENSDIVRKKFDAYVVLKIINNVTKVFKLDEELVNENLDDSIFKFDLSGQNPFAKSFLNARTESFSLIDIKLVLLDFKYACITPLKLGSQILGFFVGFKMTEISNQDSIVLESVSIKTVA